MDTKLLNQIDFVSFFLDQFIYPLIILFILLIFTKQIAVETNLIDKPDKIRKFHKHPTPILGGVFLIIVISADILFNNLLYLLNFYFWILSFCLIGLIDDLKKLKSEIKILLISLTTIIFLIFDNSLVIYDFFSDSLSRNVNLNFNNNNFIPYFFTILSCLLLFNAMNMIDGLNGICAGTFIIYYSSILILFPINNNLLNIILLIIIFLIIFLTLNLNGKIFLGDSGNYILSAILIYYLIKLDNEFSEISGERIFLVLSIPGLDMLRLFITRILNNSNPLKPDRNHLHHLLKNYFKSNFKTFIAYMAIIAFSVTLIPIFSFNIIFGVFFICISYCLLIFILKSLISK